MRIGDVGCGTGYSTLSYSCLAKLEQKTLSVTGYDIFEDLLEKANLNKQTFSLPATFKKMDLFTTQTDSSFQIE